MPCAPTQSLLDDKCLNFAGGALEIYVTEFDNVLSITASDASGVTAIELEEGKQFYKYAGVKNSISYTDVYTKSDAGSTSFTPTVTINLRGLRKEVRSELQALVRLNVIVIVKTRSKQYLLVGSGEGLEVTGFTAQSGLTGEELNGYQSLTFTGTENEMAQFVDSSIIPALLVPAVA